ncbi:MAG: glutamine-hydrolyzing carbamoyl-phosphate synthase small subunit [Candidatus Omnitrophica bacterium]|nr:glutamine-hydrolyzing carbamoyl-phosphate synthase small subunit [Candidatus Omnitrophota bacterium]
MKAILMLEDGRSFSGEALNHCQEAIGEVIFNTAVVGYQEMITDPASSNKILVLTYPLIGNYGVAPKFNESRRAWLAGLAIKESSRIYSNWQAKSSLDDFLKKQKLPTIYGLDTRTLAVHLRHKGQIRGIISTKCFDPTTLLAKIKNSTQLKDKSLLPRISVSKPKYLGTRNSKMKIAILDLGLTNSIVKQLERLGLGLTVLPYNTTAGEILRLRPKGLLISGGPEEDAGLKEVVENIKPLIGRLPILGVSTGAQVLAAALGAKIIKLKLGHHGVNYPINKPLSYKGDITVQNHSRAVDGDSIAKLKNVRITGFNLNDHSVEEFESKKLKFIGVQYIPVSPGFDEVNPAFHKFLTYLKRSR